MKTNDEAYQNYLIQLDQMPNAILAYKAKDILEHVRHTFPDLKFEIKWNQPMFTDHGTFIFGMSLSKAHLSISPEEKTMKVMKHQIEQAGYSCTARLFRIGEKDIAHYGLIDEMIRFNREDKKNLSTFWRR